MVYWTLELLYQELLFRVHSKELLFKLLSKRACLNSAEELQNPDSGSKEFLTVCYHDVIEDPLKVIHLVFELIRTAPR